MSITLTSCQNRAFERVKQFLSDDENPAIAIVGAAGTGKTTITKYIVDYIADTQNLNIAAVAPTHKARRVMHSMLNKNRFVPIPTLTVASILGKMREMSYIGSHKYSNGSRQKIDAFDCLILDEVSMVSDKDLDAIIEYICEHDKKLIIIGDSCQIPSPSQGLVMEENVCRRPDSYGFTLENICELKQIVRQVADSIIIVIASYIRDHLTEETSLGDILTATGIELTDVVIPFADLYSKFVRDWQGGLDSRVIAYTNAAVRAHNTQIRRALGYDDVLVKGELLTGYANLGFPVKVIENGTDYRVRNIKQIATFAVGGYTGLTGRLVDLVDVDDTTHVSNRLFFITVEHSANVQFLKELVKRAEKVNSYRSSKQDYKHYTALKNRTVFLENVYSHAGRVMTEADMKNAHPLLFTKIADVIDTSSRVVAVSELTDKIEIQYGEIIVGRLCDNKPFADGEVFADQYMVVEKDIYYGYSLTGHKVQGSTYDTVMVDENDFNKIKSRWNFRLQRMEDRTKERNQLRYVAYTRASKELRIIT
jgi:hypothetical protein